MTSTYNNPALDALIKQQTQYLPILTPAQSNAKPKTSESRSKADSNKEILQNIMFSLGMGTIKDYQATINLAKDAGASLELLTALETARNKKIASAKPGTYSDIGGGSASTTYKYTTAPISKEDRILTLKESLLDPPDTKSASQSSARAPIDMAAMHSIWTPPASTSSAALPTIDPQVAAKYTLKESVLDPQRPNPTPIPLPQKEATKLTLKESLLDPLGDVAKQKYDFSLFARMFDAEDKIEELNLTSLRDMPDRNERIRAYEDTMYTAQDVLIARGALGDNRDLQKARAKYDATKAKPTEKTLTENFSDYLSRFAGGKYQFNEGDEKALLTLLTSGDFNGKIGQKEVIDLFPIRFDENNSKDQKEAKALAETINDAYHFASTGIPIGQLEAEDNIAFFNNIPNLFSTWRYYQDVVKPSNYTDFNGIVVGGTTYSTNNGPLGKEGANFTDGKYTANVLSKDTTLYRIFGGRAGANGRYATNDFFYSESQLRELLALKPEWGNTTQFITTVTVPAGTTVYTGTAAQQGYGFPGGASQIFIPNPDPSWYGETMIRN